MRRKARQKTKHGCRSAAEWNAKYPIGTQVQVWSGKREGSGDRGATCTEAWDLGDGTPIVGVTGKSGGIALTHVEPID